MSNENDWRSSAFRQRVITQLDGLIRESATKTQRSAEELECQVYSRSTNRNEYLQYIARVVMHLRRNLNNSGRQQLNRISNESLNYGLQNTGNLTGSTAIDQGNNLLNPNLSLSAFQLSQMQAKNNITLSKLAQNGEQFNIQMSVGNAGGGSSQQHMTPSTLGDSQQRTPSPSANGVNYRIPSPANGITQNSSQKSQFQGKNNITLSKLAQNGEQFNIQMSVGNTGGGSSQQHMTSSTLGDIQHRTPSPAANGVNYRTLSPANGINQVPSPVSLHHRTPSPAMVGLSQHRVPSPAAGVMLHRTTSPAYEKTAPDIIVPTDTEQWPRPMQISDDWKSWRTRQRVIQQLDDLIQQTSQTTPRRDATRLESQVFQRSKQREEYLQYIARIVMRLRQSAQGHQQQNNLQSQGNTSQKADPTLTAVLPNNAASNLPNRLANNGLTPEIITIPSVINNVASGSQAGNQTPLLQQSLQQLRKVKNSDDWKTRTFRQRIIHQLEELNRWTPTTARRSPEELESQIFQRSNSKEDYMRYIGKVVLHMRQIKQANGGHSYNAQDNTSQSSSSHSRLQNHMLGIQHPQVDLTEHDDHALSIDPQVCEQQSGNSTLYGIPQMGNGLTAGGNSSQLRELLSSSSKGEGSSLQNVNHLSNPHINDFHNQAGERSDFETNKKFNIQSESEEDISNRTDINKDVLSINTKNTNTSNESEIDEFEKASDSPGAFQLLLLED